MTERELAVEVAKICERRGVNRYAVVKGWPSLIGFPDLVLWGGRQLIFREIKSDDGRCSLAQLQVHRSLAATGQNVDVWRPADLQSGRIERELREL